MAATALTIAQWKAFTKMENAEEYYPNGLKVSKPDQPMYFPVENTYRVGSAEILALMSNAVAVGTGQTGAAPLYVFCKDGVYALFVDASGQMTYSNSRVLARDVCNNPRSVTPIDAGVVFTTDRGLMMIAGEQVEEIGQPAEGDVLKYADTTSGNKEFIKIANGALRKVADLPNMVTSTDFLTYLTGAIINYNNNMRELMVSNPEYAYTYVMDRDGNWSRRDYTAAEYVNNYPTSYRVVNETTSQLKFYKVDDEGDANTSLEQRKEADNKIFYLSNVIKLDSIGFKQAYRFVVRGYFETMLRPAASGVIEGREVYFMSNKITSLEIGDTLDVIYVHGDEGNGWYYHTNLWYKMKDMRVFDKQTLREITDEYTGDEYYAEVTVTRGTMPSPVECYVLGSYDGRRWAMLGGQKRIGKFTDIGCKVERTDVKFFRICLAGQVTGKTRIYYMEMSANGSVLNTKIR